VEGEVARGTQIVIGSGDDHLVETRSELFDIGVGGTCFRFSGGTRGQGQQETGQEHRQDENRCSGWAVVGVRHGMSTLRETFHSSPSVEVLSGSDSTCSSSASSASNLTPLFSRRSFLTLAPSLAICSVCHMTFPGPSVSRVRAIS